MYCKFWGSKLSGCLAVPRIYMGEGGKKLATGQDRGKQDLSGAKMPRARSGAYRTRNCSESMR